MGVLTVFLDKATNLTNKDFDGTCSDPYVKLAVEQDNWVKDISYGTARSTTKKDNLNPVYGETFRFTIPDLTNMVLICKVKDEDVARDGKLGGCKIHLEGLGLTDAEAPVDVERVVERKLTTTDAKIFLKLSYSENSEDPSPLAAEPDVDAKYREDLESRAHSGNPDAIFEMGVRYLLGDRGYPKEQLTAFEWMEKGHAKGHIKATATLGEMKVMAYGGIPQDIIQGMAYLGIAAKSSNLAAYTLGMALADGTYGLSVDKEEAIRLLELVVDGKCTNHHLKSSLIENAREKIDVLKHA